MHNDTVQLKLECCNTCTVCMHMKYLLYVLGCTCRIYDVVSMIFANSVLPVSFKRDDKSRSAIITFAFGCIPVTLLGQPKNRSKVNVQKFTYHFHTSDYRKTKDHLFITQHPIYCIFSFECAHINNKSSLWSRIACAYFHCLKIQK